MPAEVRLIGVSRNLETGEPTLDVAVGKSDVIRRAPLNERQLLNLIKGAADQLDALRRDREAGVDHG